MMKPEDYLPRLSFIRYLYKEGLNRAKDPEPLSAVSILLIHDGAELLLELICDHVAVVTNNINFMGYFAALRTHIPVILGHQNSMDKLNRIRVNIKHHGIIPAGSEIDSAATNVTSFMEDLVSTAFNLKFEDITMTDLVSDPESKTKLYEAAQQLNSGMINQALYNISIAFQIVIDEYNQKIYKAYGRSPFQFAREEFVRQSTEYYTDEDHRQLVESVISLQNAVQTMALGIDYQKYTKFRLVAPPVYRTKNGWETDFYFESMLNDPTSVPEENYKPTVEDARFCFDFVIETAIRFQSH